MFIIKGNCLSGLATETIGSSGAKNFWEFTSTLAEVHFEVTNVTLGFPRLGSSNSYHALIKANAVAFITRYQTAIVSTAETLVVVLAENHNVLGVDGGVATAASIAHVSSSHDDSLRV
jgi:hypothetical protein